MYTCVLSQINGQWTAELGSDDLGRVRQNIYAARRTVLPTLPKSRNEVFDAVVNLSPKNRMRNEDFLCVADKNNGMIMLSCFTNLYLLCTCDTVYMGGTFQYCTKFVYKQAIHALKNGR